MKTSGLKYINIDDIVALITLLEDETTADGEVQAYYNTLILKLQVLLLDRYEEYYVDEKEKESLKKRYL